ncbi:MAG TPA: glycosyltransferase family 39 protein [Elusimicrobiota bacterium]|nr:glycosyltransferase family 39 protein [Elusimicrobiota bacterium]
MSPSSSHFSRFLHGAALALCLGAFLVLAFWDLKSPGLDRNEAWMGMTAASIDFVQAMKEGSFRSLPLHFDEHHGTWLAYAVYPFLKIMRGSSSALRVSMVFYSFLALIGIYYLARKSYGKTAALFALFLVALHPSYLVITRLGAADGSPLFLLSALMFIFLRRWQQTGRGRDFLLICFFYGLGVGTIFWFVFWGGGLAVVLLLSGREAWNRSGRGLGWHMAWGGVCFLAGMGPLTLACATGNLPLDKVVDYYVDFAHRVAPAGDYSLASVFFWRERWRTFWMTLGGEYTYIRYGASPNVNAWIYNALFVAAVAWSVGRYLGDLKKGARRGFAVDLVLLTVVYVVSATFSPTSLRARHVFPVLPWALFVSAAGFADLCGRLKNILWRRAAWAAAAGLVILSAARCHYANYFYLSRTGGGTSLNSGAVYELAEWVRARGYGRVMVGPPWMRAKLRFLASPTIRTSVSVLAEEPWTPRLAKKCEEHRRETDAYIIPFWNDKEERQSNIFKKFNRWARRQKPAISLVKVLHERNGRPAYLVYEPLDSAKAPLLESAPEGKR